MECRNDGQRKDDGEEKHVGGDVQVEIGQAVQEDHDEGDYPSHGNPLGLRIPAFAGPADRVVAWVRSQHWRRISAVLLIVAGTLLFVAALTGYFGLR